MSAIASLYLLDRDRLPMLVEAARASRGSAPGWRRLFRPEQPDPSGFRKVLAEQTRPAGQEYDWSGYCMLHLLAYLRRRGVKLEDSALDAEAKAINKVYDLTVLLTAEHRRYLDRLDPARHSEDDLAAHLARSGLDAEEAGMAGFDGLHLLHDAISRLDDRQVLLLHIG